MKLYHVVFKWKKPRCKRSHSASSPFYFFSAEEAYEYGDTLLKHNKLKAQLYKYRDCYLICDYIVQPLSQCELYEILDKYNFKEVCSD